MQLLSSSYSFFIKEHVISYEEKMDISYVSTLIK